MTAAEALKYEHDLHVYARRLEADAHPHAAHWRAAADAWSKQIADWKLEAAVKAAEEKAEQKIAAAVREALDIARENYETLKFYTVARAEEVEKVFLDEGARTRRDQQNREAAGNVQKIAKSAVETSKQVFYDGKGRVQRVELKENGITVRTKYPVYDAKSRIVEVREEKNPFVPSENV